MTDVYQPIRDYAAQQLPRYGASLADRDAYIRNVVDWTFGNQPMTDDQRVMMAERIARHMWDSTPHKVIPHAHLSPSEIPPGAQSPTGILSDANLTLDVARRLRSPSPAADGSAGQPAAGTPSSGQTG